MGISEEKFRELHEKYKNLILRQVYDMTKDYYLAQDICQETFLKLYSYRDRIEEEKAKGWMLVVSYNKHVIGCVAIKSTTKSLRKTAMWW